MRTLGPLTVVILASSCLTHGLPANPDGFHPWDPAFQVQRRRTAGLELEVRKLLDEIRSQIAQARTLGVATAPAESLVVGLDASISKSLPEKPTFSVLRERHAALAEMLGKAQAMREQLQFRGLALKRAMQARQSIEVAKLLDLDVQDAEQKIQQACDACKDMSVSLARSRIYVDVAAAARRKMDAAVATEREEREKRAAIERQRQALTDPVASPTTLTGKAAELQGKYLSRLQQTALSWPVDRGLLDDCRFHVDGKQVRLVLRCHLRMQKADVPLRLALSVPGTAAKMLAAEEGRMLQELFGNLKVVLLNLGFLLGRDVSEVQITVASADAAGFIPAFMYYRKDERTVSFSVPVDTLRRYQATEITREKLYRATVVVVDGERVSP